MDVRSTLAKVGDIVCNTQMLETKISTQMMHSGIIRSRKTPQCEGGPSVLVSPTLVYFGLKPRGYADFLVKIDTFCRGAPGF